MATNQQVFEAQIDQWAKKDMGQAIAQYTQKMVFTILDGVASLTPVDTGRARANWQVGVNSIPEGVLNETTGTKGTVSIKGLGGSTLAREASAINRIKEGDHPYIVNNVPYILVLEHGGANRTRHAMADLTLARINTFFAKEN